MSIHGGLPTTLENGSGITNKMLHFIEMPPSDDEGYFVLTKGQIIVVTEEDDRIPRSGAPNQKDWCGGKPGRSDGTIEEHQN
jgi:hypothetical protein